MALAALLCWATALGCSTAPHPGPERSAPGSACPTADRAQLYERPRKPVLPLDEYVGVALPVPVPDWDDADAIGAAEDRLFNACMAGTGSGATTSTR